MKESWYFLFVLSKISSLPAGTALPGGAVLPMLSVADFPMVLPLGTKLPGGVMVPVSWNHRLLHADQPAGNQKRLSWIKWPNQSLLLPKFLQVPFAVYSSELISD